jgi:hypothetical protein
MCSHGSISWCIFSGPIDFAPDGGLDWRDQWAAKLTEQLQIPFRQILNPRRKPLQHAPFNLDDEQSLFHKMRKEGNWADLVEQVSQVAHMDLRMTDKSDLILANFPRLGQGPLRELLTTWDTAYGMLEGWIMDGILSKDMHDSAIRHFFQLKQCFSSLVTKFAECRIPTFGTMHELVVARQQRKPVFIVWEGGIETCSGWLMWLVGGESHVFSNIDDLITRLKAISDGKAEYNARDWLLLNV